jgi:CheY-like chemotaxis protein
MVFPMTILWQKLFGPNGDPSGPRAVPIVLVVEDNAINQRIARMQLEELGYRVHVVNNGSEAVEAAARLRYDVILMDCSMPVVDGYEATARIRKHEAAIGRRTPIIALTAQSMPGDRERCLACGMDDYLSKPASKEDLGKTVSHWVKKSCRSTGTGAAGGMPNRADFNTPAP